MIIYGDPLYETTLGTLVVHLSTQLSLLLELAADIDLGQLRALLVMAGEAEQAASDAAPGPHDPNSNNPQVTALRTATDSIARAFYLKWAESSGLPSPAEKPRPYLALAARELAHLPTTSEEPLVVKVPEGFAFYALYPEQYIASALRWAEERAVSNPGRAVVVGIRSIGTTLAAVVAATLQAHGWEAHRLSVRPHGHPFEREVEIPAQEVAGAEWGLVVDEGPGLSGSSMAATAEALARAGLSRERISFFPAHDHEPGSAASDMVRAWWNGAPRYVTPHNAPIYGGLSLEDALTRLTCELAGEPGEGAHIEEISGGLWRSHIYKDVTDWPAVAPPFERPKYLCTTPGGKRLFLKFEGLATSPYAGSTMVGAALSKLTGLGEKGLSPLPLGSALGFVLTPWIDGTPLSRRDASAGVLEHIGRYVALVAEPPLSRTAQEKALARLREMLYWNTWGSLGAEIADRTHALSDAALAPVLDNLPAGYGDGRMAPHEWVRTSDGTLLKTDCTGNVWDHTAIGPQSVAWDLADSIIEWRLDDLQTGIVLRSFHSAGGAPIAAPVLRFYCAAYAAFRAGQCHLCAGMSTHDPGEEARLWSAFARYRDELARLLEGDLVEPGQAGAMS